MGLALQSFCRGKRSWCTFRVFVSFDRYLVKDLSYHGVRNLSKSLRPAACMAHLLVVGVSHRIDCLNYTTYHLGW